MLLYFSAAELKMMVAQSSFFTVFNPLQCIEVKQDQSQYAISVCIKEAILSDHAKQRATHHAQKEDTPQG